MNYRIEIISNQSVQDDIIELLEQEVPSLEYTLLPVVHGKGIKTQKMGNTTWPEQNFLLFSYTSKENAVKVKAIINAVKSKFPNEGITFFCVEEAEI